MATHSLLLNLEARHGKLLTTFVLKIPVSQPHGPVGVSSLCRCSVVVDPRYIVARSPFLAAITQRRLAIQSQTYLLEIAPLGRLMSATLRRVWAGDGRWFLKSKFDDMRKDVDCLLPCNPVALGTGIAGRIKVGFSLDAGSKLLVSVELHSTYFSTSF